MFWYDDGWAAWQMAAMGVGMIVFWGLAIAVVYMLITRTPSGGTKELEDPRRTLDRRLAAGEINAEEYRRLLQLLEAGNRQPGDLRERA